MSLSRKNLICTAFVVSHLFSSGNASFTTTSDILSDFIIPLPKDNWSLRSNDLVFENLTAQVPGDLLSDLMRNRLIDDPYVDRNFLIQRSVWMGESLENSGRDDIVSGVNEDGGRKPRKRHSQRKRTWIYSTTFELPAHNSEEVSWKLVFEGIKMGADIFINHIQVGQVVDQFLRYELDIGDDILERGVLLDIGRQHNLTVSFDPSIHVSGRFSACSGGWDWSPYTRERDGENLQTFTLGIVKPVYIIGIGIQRFYISHVVPKVYYLGKYPTKPLVTPEGDFRLTIDVHLRFVDGKSFSSLANSSIILMADFNDQVTTMIPISEHKFDDEFSSVISMNLIVLKESVDLWWPNGMGKQPLYNIYVGTSCIHNAWIKKRIGFRTSALVTSNESNNFDLNDAYREPEEGSGQFGMYFRINGAVIMARGANFIPMDQLEGRLSSNAHKIAVKSASKANMNMLRVWGGGMVPLDAFYDACDEEGILIYHDMMFVEEAGHRPLKTNTISQEIRHLVRSLASHPSLLVWNGCNECEVVMGTPSEIYASFVMEIVAEEDDTRPIWPSSPSKHGWKSGVRRLDSRPLSTNRNLTTWEPNAFSTDLESHGPYMRSFSHSYPGVNGIDVHFPYCNTPPKLREVDIGQEYPNQFVSEFGSSTMSSFESMTGTLTNRHWGLHGGSDPDKCNHEYGNRNRCNGTNVMAERNYPCDSHIKTYFGLEEEELSAIGKFEFRKQLYMCLISQTLWMKGEVETRRSKNYLGLLIWQLNEVWPTGGWGLIEYGRKSTDGSQILGGRWKPLMHLLKSSLFADQIVACGEGDLCYVRNDHIASVKFAVVFEAWDIEDTTPLKTFTYRNELAAGSIVWFKLPDDFTSSTQVVLLELNVQDDYLGAPGLRTSETVYLKDVPKRIKGLRSPVRIEILEIHQTMNGYATLVLRSDKLALFVVLTTRAEGVFSDNAFFLRPFENKTVEFQSLADGVVVDLQVLKTTLRIEHLGLYSASGSSLSEN